MSTRGRFQIKRISPAGDPSLTYQVSHESLQGGEFVGSVEGEHLQEFLRKKLRLAPDVVRSLIDELQRSGHVLLPDAEMSEADLAAAGLDYLDPAV